MAISDLFSWYPDLISTRVFLPRSVSKSSALKSPPPGLFTQILSSLKVSPFFISLIDTTDAKAKAIVGASSITGC